MEITSRTRVIVTGSSMVTMSTRGVMTSRIGRSAEANRLSIISRSTCSMLPPSSPSSARARTSASVTDRSAGRLTPNSFRTRPLRARNTTATGSSTLVTTMRIGATAMPYRSGYRAANVFGVISPATSTIAVMPNVATMGPTDSLIRSTASTVAMEVARMLTKLLATRMVPIVRSGSATSVASFSPRLPDCARVGIRSRGIATTAVSEPDRNPDATKQANKTSRRPICRGVIGQRPGVVKRLLAQAERAPRVVLGQ